MGRQYRCFMVAATLGLAACSDGAAPIDPAGLAGDGTEAPSGGAAGATAVAMDSIAQDPAQENMGPTAMEPMPADAAQDMPAAAGDEPPLEPMPPAEAPIDPALVLTENIVVPQVPPGGEATVCLTKQLDNPEAVPIVEVRANISDGSHHFIVDRSPVDVSIPELTPCIGLSGVDASRLLIAEKRETVFRMPEGVGFTLRPQQNLTLELHYINYTTEPLDVEGVIEMILAPQDARDGLVEAGMIFTGNTGIALLPGQQATIEFFGLPAATPQAPIHIFAMTSHMHQLGVRSYIERVPDALAANGELLHESLDWAQPPMDQYEPPLVFTGSDGVRLRCEFNNTTDRLVTFGTRFADEMCFMWLYYYPNTGALF